MSRYVDGYVLPVPKKKLAAYKKLAQAASKIWRGHGALEYYECVAEDLTPGFGVSFAKLVKLKQGETVIFSWVIFKSRRHRDQVNAKVMADPRLTKMMDPKKPPFDCNRITMGGFIPIVQA